MSSEKILVVEDENDALERTRQVLENDGYIVSTAKNGHDALAKIADGQPDLVILDINLDSGEGEGPVMDGIEVLREMRKESDACVLMLTTTSISYVKVAALTMGADDYLTKPFDPKELTARVQAILRRAGGASRSGGGTLAFKGISIDPGARIVLKNEEEVKLTPIEFDLLLALARRRGQVIGRGQLISQAWDFKYAGDERLVDVHMGRLRKKLEDDPAKPQLIHTVWGKGYRFEGEAL
jgi:two-component system, OmpR family, response regulator ResD